MVVRVRPFFNLSLLLFAVTSPGLVISSVYQFTRKQKIDGLVSVLTLITSIACLVITAITFSVIDIFTNNVQL